MSRLRVVIVGAGIGGLTAAIALARDGHDVTIVERARELTSVGAGIALWPNALRALKEIDLGDQIVAVGAPFTSTTIQTRDGRQLSAFSPDRVLRWLGGQPLIARRADVQSVLLAAAAAIPMRLGTAVIDVDQIPNSAVRVVTESGDQLHADLVVGADGVHSIVRALLDSSKPTVSPLLAWRAVVSGRPVTDDAWLSIGDGHQFLATSLPGGRGYITGLLGPVDGAPPERDVESLSRAYAGWHQPVPELVARARDVEVRWDPVLYRHPPRSSVIGNVVLIGDAAHPMTPDLGQGGCQAIEDAVVLAAAVRHGGPDGLSRFDRVRRRRVALVVNGSHRLGGVLALRSRPAVAIRDLLMPAIPEALRLAQITPVASTRAFERNLAAVLVN